MSMTEILIGIAFGIGIPLMTFIAGYMIGRDSAKVAWRLANGYPPREPAGANKPVKPESSA